MEEETSMQMTKKNREMLAIVVIIALFALYLGYMDGRHDKNTSKEDTTTTIQN